MAKAQEKFYLHSLRTLGHTITVVGKPVGKRAIIKLFVGDKRKTIAFRFQARFDEKVILINSHLDGKWQTEQRARENDFEWLQTSYAEYKIEVGADEITCSWNGQKLPGCTFKHRADPQTYAGLKVGGLDVDRVDIQNNGTDSALEETPLNLKCKPVAGRNIRLIATPVKARSIFNFNIDDADEKIAFHFNPRFDQKVIVRNSKINAGWQNEERSMVVPFTWQLNQEYEYNIYVGQDYFSCVWEGVEVCRFNHRSPVEQDIGIAINGMCIKSIRGI